MKRIFYDVVTGFPILEIQPQNEVLETVERNIEQFTILSERNRDTFDYIELEFGQYAEEFAMCSAYRVNVETKELEFIYPDPDQPDIEQPYKPPLSKEVELLRDKNQELEQKILDSTKENTKLKDSVARTNKTFSDFLAFYYSNL